MKNSTSLKEFAYKIDTFVQIFTRASDFSLKIRLLSIDCPIPHSECSALSPREQQALYYGTSKHSVMAAAGTLSRKQRGLCQGSTRDSLRAATSTLSPQPQGISQGSSTHSITAAQSALSWQQQARTPRQQQALYHSSNRHSITAAENTLSL